MSSRLSLIENPPHLPPDVLRQLLTEAGADVSHDTQRETSEHRPALLGREEVSNPTTPTGGQDAGTALNSIVYCKEFHYNLV